MKKSAQEMFSSALMQKGWGHYAYRNKYRHTKCELQTFVTFVAIIIILLANMH